MQPGLVRSAAKRVSLPPEKTLLLGWNDSAPIIVRELDHYVAKGSTVTVVAGREFEEQAQACCNLQNQELSFHAGDTTDRVLLDSLDIPEYNHVIALADTSLDI